MKTEDTFIPVGKKARVSAAISAPESYRSGEGTGVIVAHGAGNDMNHPLIVSFCRGLAKAGYLTLRFNFPYREKGRRTPDRQETLIATWQSVHQYLVDHSKYKPERIVAAGKSMGGRLASQMVAEGLLPVVRLIFLGYPLHPPGRKDKLREKHFQRITIPMLFFAGSRDSLCDLTLLKEVLRRLPGPWELEVIEGGDHSFRLPRSPDTSQEEVHKWILERSVRWLET